MGQHTSGDVAAAGSLPHHTASPRPNDAYGDRILGRPNRDPTQTVAAVPAFGRRVAEDGSFTTPAWDCLL